MHNRFSQSALLDDSSSEEDYSDEIDNFNDTASSGDGHIEESPVDSKSDFRNAFIEESSSEIDYLDFQEPMPLLAGEVMSLINKSPSHTLDPMSHPMFDMDVCPTLEYVVEEKNENNFDTCIPEKFEVEKLLREDSKILNDDFYSVQSKSMCIEQNSDSFEKNFIDSVLVHFEGHENSLTKDSDPTLFLNQGFCLI